MKTTNKTNEQIEKLVLIALLTAMVAVLSYFGGFIKIGGFASISLTLIPVVIGAALCGPLAGAWLGGMSGAVFFTTVDAVFWFGLSIPGTVITVMAKGILAGLSAGLVYKLFEKSSKYLAVIISAIVCPVVNTAVFLLGSMIFFVDTVKAGASAEGTTVFVYLIVFFVGLNFVFELLANIIFSPIILKVLSLRKKA